MSSRTHKELLINPSEKGKEQIHREYDPKKRRERYLRKREEEGWRERTNRLARERKRRVKKFIRRYKLLVGCRDCGFKGHHAALDFDHIRGVKKLNVCDAKSIPQAREEIAKCEVVCSNCHRVRTFNRIQEKKIEA